MYCYACCGDISLDYCKALYVGLPLAMAQKLQLVQSSVAYMLVGPRSRVHTTPIIRELRWLLITFHVQFEVLVLTCKALDGLGRCYLKDHFLQHHCTCALCSVSGALLCVLPVDEVHLARIRRRLRAFSGATHCLWNILQRCPPGSIIYIISPFSIDETL